MRAVKGADTAPEMARGAWLIAWAIVSGCIARIFPANPTWSSRGCGGWFSSMGVSGTAMAARGRPELRRRADYWRAKIGRNRVRDGKNMIALKAEE
jgi:hypothetical protein